MVLAVALTVLQIVALAAFAAGSGLGTKGYIDAAAMGVATQTGMGEELGEALVAMWPGALVTMNGFTAMLVVVGVGLVGTRFGVVLRRIPALATLDLDPRTVILPIVAIALLAAGRLPLDGAETVGIVGKNLLVIARWVFFLQGVAVFAGLYAKAKVARPMRTIGFVLLGVTEAFAPAVSITGFADIWLNLRRLPRDGAKAEPPQEDQAPPAD